jgi:hypothetical protein
MSVVDVFWRKNFASDVHALSARIQLYQICKLLHVYLSVVANGKTVIQTEHFVPKNSLSPCIRCLIFIEMLFCLFTNLYLADLVIGIQQLIRNIASIHHKLHLRSKLPLRDQVGIVCFHFEHQQYQQFVAFTHSKTSVLQ